MKVSLDWLNAYLDRPVDADEVERLLTEQGFPIESRESVSAAGAEDVVIDAEITSNRGDCLSHVGIAREVAAGSGRVVHLPDCTLPSGATPSVEQLTSIASEARELCPLYTARVIRDVSVGPSPDWLVRWLAAVGMRSVNNVVDITNFVLMELGQPLHAFDLDRLHEERIVVRTARQGETFTAIDGSKHELDADMLVIADGARPVAIAGVMGGLDSEVTGKTKNILLESALFDPLSVRQTSRALKLSSESSYRFERGVDVQGVEVASRRAAKLLVDIAEGTLATGVIRVGIDPPTPRAAVLRPGRCRELLGIDLPTARMVELLDRLGLQPQHDAAQHDGPVNCTVPPYRLDLEREVDLIEEVARLHGLDEIPVQEKIHIVARSMQPAVAARQEIGRIVIAHGYHEAVTFSFVSEAHGRRFVREGDEPLVIEDVRRRSEPVLRPSLLPSLLACRKSNQDVGNHGVRLFEAGAVWSRRNDEIIEQQCLGLLCDADDPDAALRDLRGTIAELVEHLRGGVALEVSPQDHNLYEAAGALRQGDETLGTFGLLSHDVQDVFGLQQRLAAAELALPPLLERYPPPRRVEPLPRYPGIERDLSVIVDDAVQWAQVERAVQATQPALLEELSFVGIYRGKPIARGRKSVTLRLRFRDPQTTLRHEQVDPQVEAVVTRLRAEVDAELRS